MTARCHDDAPSAHYELTAALEGGQTVQLSGGLAYWFGGSTNPAAAFQVYVEPHLTSPIAEAPLLSIAAYADEPLSFPAYHTFHIDTIAPDLFIAFYQGTLADSGTVAFRPLAHGAVEGDVDLWFTVTSPSPKRIHLVGYVVAPKQREINPPRASRARATGAA